ncbi:hypothetical protein [Roseibium sp. M-1]
MRPAQLAQIAEEANLAPSVHNTQPTRWQRDGTGALLLTLAADRLLAVGDPKGQDARFSGGTALRGTVLALARQGLGVKGWEIDGGKARLEFGGEPAAAPDLGLLQKRTTWRGGFSKTSAANLADLTDICNRRSDVTLAAESGQIHRLAELNDMSSLGIMRNPAFRAELCHWMRFTRSDPRWSKDGLSAEALAMSGFEARAAQIVLRRPVFEMLDRLGLGKAIVSEGAKTRSATGLATFHRPRDEDCWTSGMHFYDFWIALTAAGLAAWPMAVLADDPDANREVVRLLGLPETDRLITVLRVGPHPGARQPAKARLGAAELVREV